MSPVLSLSVKLVKNSIPKSLHASWARSGSIATRYNIQMYTLLQKKVYTLFPGEYSNCKLSRACNWLEGQPIRVLQQSSLSLWKNSKWYQSPKDKFVGKLCRKVHKNLFLPLTSLLLADRAYASDLCFRTLEPIWIFSQTRFCLVWNSSELSPIPCHGSYMT